MSHELVVPVALFVAIMVGGVSKAILGMLNAISGGEKFQISKLLATLIATFFESAGAFAGFYVADMTVQASGLVVLIVMALYLGYFGSVPAGKTGAATINKVTGGG